MIVKCERCQTRFKIPDEKVTDKGVKVRCTKCQNTFRVTRDATPGEVGAPPAPPPGAEADPFAPFGAAPDPRHAEITKPGFFAQGVEATRGPPAGPPSMPWNSVDGDLDTEAGVFREPTRVGPVPLPPAARPPRTPFDGPEPAGAVPLPAPLRAQELTRRATTMGLYGSSVPPPVGGQGAHAQGGPVPLPGVAAPRSAPPAPSAGAPGAAMPAPVTMFGSQKGGAQAPTAARGGPGAAPMAGSRPPPAPGGPPSTAQHSTPPELGGADPFADLLGAPGDSVSPGAFDLPPSPRAPGASAPAGAFDLLPSPKASSAAGPAGAPDPRLSPRASSAAGPAGAPDPRLSPRASSAAGPAGAPDPRLSPRAPGGPVPVGAPDPRSAPSADALRRAAAPPASAPAGAVAVGPMRPAPAPAAPAFAEEDPFGAIDIDDATVTDIRKAAPAPLPPPVGEDPFGAIDLDDATVTAVQAPPGKAPGATRTAAPAPLSPSAGEDPFGAIDLDDATVTAVHAPPRSPPGKAPSGAAAPASLSPLPGEDPFASLDLGGPAPASRAPAAQPGRAPAPPAQPAPAAPKDLFDLSSDLDSFGEHAGVQPTDTGRAALFGTSAPSTDSLDDLGAPPASSGGSLLGDVPPAEDAQEFSVTLGRVGAPAAGAVEVLDVAALPSTPSVTVARPTARPEDVGIPQSRPPSRARKATALIANLVVATVLVVGFSAVGSVYLSEGRVDLSVLSPDRLRDFIFPAPRPLVALDVTNALYDTKAGRPLFFVRGEAENRTGAATRIRVRAALYDGNQRVRSAEALAGALPTPEDLYAVGNADAATALSQRLDAAATLVVPGAKAPFLVIFQEYPADLGGFRLEVTLEPVPAAAPEAGRRTE